MLLGSLIKVSQFQLSTIENLIDAGVFRVQFVSIRYFFELSLAFKNRSHDHQLGLEDTKKITNSLLSIESKIDLFDKKFQLKQIKQDSPFVAGRK